MTVIERIRKKMREGEYEFVIPHFFEEMAEDGLILSDIEMAIRRGRIRRKFSRDPRGKRYEVAGRIAGEREIAVVCRIKSTGKLLLITTYEVDRSA